MCLCIHAMLALDKGFYVGTFRHGLDVKNRLTIPAKWRFPGDEGEASYLALPNPNGSITVYPPRMVLALEEKIQRVSMLGDEQELRALTRIFGPAERFGCDKQGRIGLPDALRAHAGLPKQAEAVLVGTITTFHIWESVRYAAFVAATPDDTGSDPAVLRKYGL
jgi:MraZ protein